MTRKTATFCYAGPSLEGSCSIQLSYGRALRFRGLWVGSEQRRVNAQTEQGGNVRHMAAQYRHTPRHTKCGSEARWLPRPDPDHKTCVGGVMADPFPKSILPLLKGKFGELRAMRFWSKVDMRGPDECWEWQGTRGSGGYGRFKIASYETVSSNRMALISTKREEPIGLHVLHHCDNPPCCNPAHLYFGTVAQNARDKVARGRARTGDQAGASNGAAKLTEEQVALVVRRLQAGWNNKQIAADLPVTHSMVSLIRLGRMWRETTARLGWEPGAQFTRKCPLPLPASVGGRL